MSSGTAVADDLVEVGHHWSREAVRLGARYAQSFVEASADLRLDSRLWRGAVTATGASITRRYGLGLLLHHRGTWKYAYAPLHQPDQIAGRLAELGVAGARAARALHLAETFDTEPVAVEPVPDNALAAGPPGTAVRFIREYFRQRRVVVDSAGTCAAQLVRGGRLRATATVVDGAQRTRAFSRRSSPTWRPDSTDPAQSAAATELVQASVAAARALLSTASLGERRTPVVFEPRAGAALLHELVGHALEADNVARQSDYARGLMGSRLTDAPLTVVDDPGLPDGIGSRDVDDDGQSYRPTRLVHDGVVVGQLTSLRMSGSWDGAEPQHGHCGFAGRRENYRHTSLPRASNTVVAAGPDDPTDLYAPSPGGVLVVRALGSGEFHPARGEFSFSAAESHYLTPDGNSQPLRDVYLFGDVHHTIARLSAVANDVAGDNVTCRKQGQSLLIGLYSPTMRFDDLHWRC
jgi:predicted Zn-dependent protease